MSIDLSREDELYSKDLEEIGLSNRPVRALKRKGYNTIGDILSKIVTEENLRKLDGMGKKAGDELISKLKELGIPLENEREKKQQEAKENGKTPIEELGVPEGILNVLRRAGYYSIEDIKITERIPGLGRKGKEKLIEAIREKGLIDIKEESELDKKLREAIARVNKQYIELRQQGEKIKKGKQKVSQRMTAISEEMVKDGEELGKLKQTLQNYVAVMDEKDIVGVEEIKFKIKQLERKLELREEETTKLINNQNSLDKKEEAMNKKKESLNESIDRLFSEL